PPVSGRVLPRPSGTAQRREPVGAVRRLLRRGADRDCRFGRAAHPGDQPAGNPGRRIRPVRDQAAGPRAGGSDLPVLMAMIHQPLPETTGRVATPDGTAQLMPYQFAVVVSIAANRVIELPSDAPRFPAVLDTGNNHNFAIRREQFARWTGLTL